MALVEPTAIPLPSSPHTSLGSSSDVTNSLISVRLSEPVSSQKPVEDAESESVESAESDTTVEPDFLLHRRSSFDIMHGVDTDLDTKEGAAEEEEVVITDDDEATSFSQSSRQESMQTDTAVEEFPSIEHSRTSSCSSRASTDSTPVDWSELDNKEESEQREEGADESTTFLLARLEQENNAIATDPRAAIKTRLRKQSRPPSIQVLKKLVQNPSEVTRRYSLLPNPPPMTELEFWAALVKDYSQTAQRLPTLTTSKIRGGVPPPLRGVVWMSVVGARDRELSDDFDKLSEETSPYENMIGKDIGRSFPGVEMFKEAGGEGQQALAKVLKCFSLYDKEIGYCQGLGFLVGPLLMQMGDKDSFCVLVRLMENYDLRSCFMPDLAGLHLRIYQFQQLLNQHMPTLAAHLASLQVEAAYLSQWFLSFFAVTCPLPMLFRIYDVILAEGASETIMRVALSLMRRNESRLMAQTEFEEVMQLLLSRALWEPYAFSADDLVNDFVSLTGMVTRESLQKLETSFKEAPESETVAKSAFFPSVAATASSFLGRLWTTNSTAKQSSLSPSSGSTSAGANEKRPTSILKRSASKQSIASTLNSTDISSEGTGSVGTVMTDATAISRDSSGDVLSVHSKTGSIAVPAMGAVSREDKGLHGQIEDLLTALSEMQRDQSLLTSQLQKEREERDEDYRVFEELIKRVKIEEPEGNTSTSRADRRQTAPSPASLSPTTISLSTELGDIVELVEQRLEAHCDLRRSSMLETKQRLRESLLRSKDQLGIEMARSVELTRQLDLQEKESNSLRDQLREARARVQDGFQERQKLEKSVQELKAASRRESLVAFDNLERPAFFRNDTADVKRVSVSLGSGSGSSSPVTPASAGLRELRLNRSSGGSGATNLNNITLTAPSNGLPSRSSSLATQSILATKNHVPASEEQMLVELVNAKTAEAVARQELEEVKSRMDALRKMLSLPSPTALAMPGTPAAAANVHKPSPSESTIVPGKSGVGEATLTPPASGGGGGFWSWGRKASGPAKGVNGAGTPPAAAAAAAAEKS